MSIDVDQFSTPELRERAAACTAALEQILVILEPLCDLADELAHEYHRSYDSAVGETVPGELRDEIDAATGERALLTALHRIHELGDYEAMHSSWLNDQGTPHRYDS